MVLRPLEFVDCLLDSPYFRENLHNHEREVESTSKSIKLIVNACRTLIDRTRELSKAHRLFANSLSNFQSHFSVLGSDQTDDEADLESSLAEISSLLLQIEDEREHMLDQLEKSFIEPMNEFRKKEIGNAKEEKKKFDKQTAKYCASWERYLGAKAKSLGDDKQLEETTDAQLRQDYAAFVMNATNYVKVVQEVQERKKFIVADSEEEFINSYRECAMTYTQKLQEVELKKRCEIMESLLRFMNQQMVFYHLGYEIFENFKPYTSSLQSKIQKLRAAFDSTTSEADNLKRKMLMNPKEYMRASQYKGSVLTGYLLVSKKQKTVLNAVWSKHFCEYSKETRKFKMVPYNQSNGAPKLLNMDIYQLKSCVRIGTDTYDRRFCFTVMLDDSTQKQVQLVLQAPDENELRLWLDAMEGKEQIEHAISTMSASQGTYKLSREGTRFVQSCIAAVEYRGLTEAGLYRVVGLTSKVEKLLSNGLEKDITTELMDPETDLKVITSAIKQYFRRLTEPLMTFELHSDLIQAAKQDIPQRRIAAVHLLVHQLPEYNFFLLKLLMQHLYKVACHHSQNLMNVSNLGVCFGPTLMRQKEETMAAIMDIKFCNVIVEILIENYHQIFETPPNGAGIDNLKASSAVNKPTMEDVFSTTTVNAFSAAAAAAIANRQQGPPPRPNPPAMGRTSTAAEVSVGASRFFPKIDYREMPIECDGLADPDRASSSDGPELAHSLPAHSTVGNHIKPPHREGLADHRNNNNNHAHGHDNNGSATNTLNASSAVKSLPAPAQMPPPLPAVSRMHSGAEIFPFLASRQRSSTTSELSSSSNDKVSSTPPPAALLFPLMQSMQRQFVAAAVVTTDSSSSLNSQQKQTPQPTPAPSEQQQTQQQQQQQPQKQQQLLPANIAEGSPALRPRSNSNSLTPATPEPKTSPFANRRQIGHVPRLGRRLAVTNSTNAPKRARALYDCDADTEGELSFKTGDIIENIRESTEDGWLEGSFNGRVGLIPANFVVLL